MSKVTVFKDLYSLKNPKYVEIDYVLKRIQEEACKELVEAIRLEKDKSSRNLIKKKLPCVLFSGVFSERLDTALVEHSGFICLDFDGFETIENLDAEGKEKLIEVLLSEKALNTILVSHGFSHPLLEKTFVTKTNNISRIES